MAADNRPLLFAISLIATVVGLRIYLYLYPSTNLNIGTVNIHHLYLGAFFLVLTVILLMSSMTNVLVILLAGISSGLVLDELVYLIATDGSDLAYLSSISLWGAVALTLTALFSVYVAHALSGKNVKKSKT